MKRVSFTAGLVVAGLLFTAQANAREGQALVQSISGEVTMLANGGKWLPLQTGEMLKSGAVVKTGAKSRADLFLGINGSMLRLAANTELKFTRLTIEQSPIEPIAQTEMELISGRIIGNVRKLPMGSSYVIKTPKGEAKVKGTVYDINADGELVVVSGKVKYTDNTNGKEVLIASGGKYVGGREMKAADDERAESAAAAPTNSTGFPSFTISVPLRQGVWENQAKDQRAGPIDPTQFISPTPTFFGDLVVRSGSAFAPDKLEIVLDASAGSGLTVGQKFKPSDLQLSVDGGVISDDNAIIVVEKAGDSGAKKLVITSTGDPFAPAEVDKANSVPVVVSIPTSGGNSVSVDVDLVAPLKAPYYFPGDLDDSGSAKSIIISTDEFTKDEADTYITTIKEQLGDLDNFEINGEMLNADEVDIIATVVPTGDESTPFRVDVTIKQKNPDASFGKNFEITFVAPPVVDPVDGATPPPVILPPQLSPTEG